MKDRSQFGADPREKTPGPVDCASVEPLLAEAAEGALPEAAARKLEVHLSACPACRALVQQATRGREWLLVLKQEAVEPSPGLVAKILARTSGEIVAGTMGTRASGVDGYWNAKHPASAAGAGESSADPAVITGALKAPATPSWPHTPIAVMRRTLVEPRLALVAAMAFFSLSLTLNLLGVRLTTVRPSDFTPAHMRRAVTRQYAQANARVVRYYENLRIVYEVESQVQELRRAAQTTTPAAGSSSAPSKDRKQSKGASKSSDDQSQADGHRLANSPANERKHFTAPVDPKPIAIGPVIEADLHMTSEDMTSRDMTSELRLFNDSRPRAATERLVTPAAPRTFASMHFVLPERSLA